MHERGSINIPGKYVGIGLVAVACAIWWVVCMKPPSIKNSFPYGKNIILFGNSLASGYGVAQEQSFCSLLSQRLGVEIINAGREGDTTSLAIKRFQSDVLDREPKVVIIELGGNDILQQIPRPETLKNLETMIIQSQEAGAAVVLLGVEGPLGLGGLGGMYKELSREHGTGLVKNILKGLLGRSQYMADQIHPNPAGHAIIADRVEKELRRALPKVFGKK